MHLLLHHWFVYSACVMDSILLSGTLSVALSQPSILSSAPKWHHHIWLHSSTTWLVLLPRVWPQSTCPLMLEMSGQEVSPGATAYVCAELLAGHRFFGSQSWMKESKALYCSFMGITVDIPVSRMFLEEES